MKKLLCLSLFFSFSHVMAMNPSGEAASYQIEEENKQAPLISHITRIKKDMSVEDMPSAIVSDLCEFLSPKLMFPVDDIQKEEERNFKSLSYAEFFYRGYFDDGGSAFGEENPTPLGSRICILKDDSEWVKAEKKGLERLIGYIYLKSAIEYLGLKKIRVAETRFSIKPDNYGYFEVNVASETSTPLKGVPVLRSENVQSFSAYVGDQKPSDEDAKEERNILVSTIGFIDCSQGGNLRLKDGIIYIIDTEYKSFSSQGIENFAPKKEERFRFNLSNFLALQSKYLNKTED